MGGAFGSLLAVSGVIFIEERKRKLEIKNRDQRLMDLLQNLRDGLKKWSGSVIMVDGLTHIRLMEFFDILSLSNVILKGGGATSHLSRIRQIVAVDKVSAALAELEPTLLEAKAILNAGWAADGVYLALVKIWPGLSAVFFSVNGIWDSLGEIYEADYPWGWPVEPPSCHRVCLGSGDIAS